LDWLWLTWFVVSVVVPYGVLLLALDVLLPEFETKGVSLNSESLLPCAIDEPWFEALAVDDDSVPDPVFMNQYHPRFAEDEVACFEEVSVVCAAEQIM